MSAFDDEFGLFGDDDKPSDEERTSTLGARRIASDEAAHDDIEPEDERPRRGPRNDRRDRAATGGGGGAGAVEGERRPRREYGADRGARKTDDPAVAQQRALDLLGFLARKLVSRPENVLVEEVDTDKGPVVELVVEHEDLGKVIGRNGRVAQALRTLVRASAEGRLSIDIISFEDEVVEGASEAGADIGRSAGSDDADDDAAATDDAVAATGDAAAATDDAAAASDDAVAATEDVADGAAKAGARPSKKRSRKTEK